MVTTKVLGYSDPGSWPGNAPAKEMNIKINNEETRKYKRRKGERIKDKGKIIIRQSMKVEANMVKHWIFLILVFLKIISASLTLVILAISAEVK